MKTERSEGVTKALDSIWSEDTGEESTVDSQNDWKEWGGLRVLCLGYFFTYSCYALHAPFFPKEATDKGVSLTWTGFVIGVYQLVNFSMSLVVGSMLGKVRPKTVATFGIFLMAVCSILFGFLKFVYDPTTFIILALIIRILQAGGNAAYITSAFTTIAQIFPKVVTKAIAYMETAGGLGLIMGPVVGGGLYELGGFVTPFVILGVLLLASGILVVLFIPNVIESSEPILEKPCAGVEETKKKDASILDLVKISSVTVGTLSVFAGSCGFGYLLPTLEQAIKHNFNLPNSLTGLLFAMDGVTYCLSNPIWAWLCQKYERPRLISLVSLLIMVVGYSVIGPLPVFPWEPNFPMTCLGFTIFGCGLGGVCVSAFIIGLGDAKAHGFEDSTATYGSVSGLWSANLALGAFIGSCAGGFLSDIVSFESGTYFVVVVQIFVILMTCHIVLKYGFRIKSKVDTPSLKGYDELS